VAQLEKRNEELRTKLSNAENDSEKFEGNLQKVCSENDIVVNQKDTRIRELLEELKVTKEGLKDAELRAEQERARNDAKVSRISMEKVVQCKSALRIMFP
jgi:chromosome segregation ATPase